MQSEPNAISIWRCLSSFFANAEKGKRVIKLIERFCGDCKVLKLLINVCFCAVRTYLSVQDAASFPLFDAAWGGDEELLLLEAIEMFGFGNWSDIADHVGTKVSCPLLYLLICG